MRYLSADKVLAAAQAARFRPTPVIEGYFLPKRVAAIFAAHEQSDIPVVAGSTANDIGTSNDVRKATSVAEYRAAAQKAFGDNTEEFLRVFPATNDAEVKVSAEQVGLGSGMGLGARAWVHAQSEYGHAPAYLFLFSRTQPYSPGIVFADHDPATAGAYHTGDVPYWLETQDAFNLFRQTRDWTPYDRELANTMSGILISFAKNGVPNSGNISLIKYDHKEEQRVRFGNRIDIETMNTQGMDFLAEHPISFSLPAPAPLPPSTQSQQQPERATY